ncbi:type II toxin-antitoxin system RelE/ParE family toxin [Neptunicella sp.]|uniref:type II toxin-antitoxin system RelE/ParE family toxin n=1 Tax=Neptunicella sp. TaxID=2125986 RepID=UPI003F68F158
MSKYTLSNKAESDLERIYQYTSVEFGQEQAESYLLGIHEALEALAIEPNLAQGVSDIRAGYLRFVYRKHYIFFKVRPLDIFVVRVLHQQMKFQLHLTS